MPHQTIDGVDLFYETSGDGPPLLLIMGYGESSESWALNRDAFAAHYRTITFDNRGTGQSDKPGEEVTSIARMADDAAGLLDALGIERAHVVSASMGGTIAQEFAIRHLAKVNRLVLAWTWNQANPVFLAVLDFWRHLAETTDPRTRLREEMLWSYTNRFFADPATVEGTLDSALASPYLTPPATYARQFRGIQEWTGTRFDDLRRITAPTLVLVGREDILTPPAFSEAIAGQIPNARLQVIDGKHGLFFEYADQFNQAVLEFLG